MKKVMAVMAMLMSMAIMISCASKKSSGSKTAAVVFTAPVNLEATPLDASVLLTWSPNGEDQGVAGYNVYLGEASRDYKPAVNVGNIVANGQLSYRATGLVNGKIYFFTVRAYLANGKESPAAAEKSAIPQVLLGDMTPPTAPTNLIVTPGNSTVELSWSPSAATDVFTYELLNGTAAGVYGAPTNVGSAVGTDGKLHFVVNNLTNGQIYYFTVRAVDRSGNRSGNAVEVSAIPQVPANGTDQTPPVAPANLAAIAGDTIVDLRWSAVSDALYYRVRVRQNGQSYGVPVNIGNATSFQVTGLTNGVQHVFAVSAVDAAGNESALSTEVSAIPTGLGITYDTTPPAVPTGLSVIAGSGVAEVSFVANTDTDLSGYVLFYDTIQGGHANMLNIGNRTFYRFESLTVGQTYYFSVRAYDLAGNMSDYVPDVSAIITANAAMFFAEQLDERITLTVLNNNIPPRLLGAVVTAGAISEVCWNSDIVGQGINSNRCVAFGQAATSTIITNIPTDAFRRLKGNASVKLIGGAIVYFDLTLWGTVPLGGIWPNGQGGLEVNLIFSDLPPATPSNLVGAAGNAQATFSWQANTEPDLAGYRLHYGTATGVYLFHLNIGNVSSHILQGLVNGMIYYVVITAYDANGHESGYSNEVNVGPNVTVGPDTIPPLIPQDLFLTPGNGLVNAYWSRNPDLDLASYNVYYGTSPGNYTNVVTQVVTTNITLLGLTNGLPVYVAISAVDLSGNESLKSIQASATPNGPSPDLTPPIAPVNLIVALGDGVADFRWSANFEPDLGGYIFSLGTVSGVYTTNLDLGNLNSYSLPLTNGNVYYVAVRAYDNSPNRNISAYSLEVTAAPVADLPPPVNTGLVAVAGDAYIDAAWSPNSATDLAGYRIYYGTSSGVYIGMIDIGNVLTTRLTSLANGTRYYIVTTAYDLNNHESAYSAEVSAVPTIAPDVIPPANPVNLVAQPGDALIRLIWSRNLEPDLQCYMVYWGSAPGVYSNMATNVVNPNYQVNGLANGVRYYFSVRAMDNAGNASGLAIERSAVPNGVIPDTTPPAIPVNPMTVTGNQTITVSWSPNIEADLWHYNLRYGTSPGVYGAAINAGSVANYQIINLTNGVIYYIVITAVDTANNESGYSVEVTGVPSPMAGPGDTTPPGAPTAVTAVGRNGSVDLGWTNPVTSDFWGVKLFIGTSSGSSNVDIQNLGNRSTYSVALTNGVTYYFSLTAYDTSINESGHSMEVFATPATSGGGGGPAPTNLAGSSTSSGTATLSWNTAGSPFLGTVIYVGYESGVEFRHVDANNLSSLTIAGLDSGRMTYFWAKAYDCCGGESGVSNEVSFLIQ